MIYTIAVDGPVGAGKSSVADEVARRLGILHLDTGAMYRAFAWYALKQGISMEDEQALTALTEKMMPEVRYENGSQRTIIDGQDVTDLIRTPEISMATSTSSKFAGVRKAMVRQQQALAKKQSMLLDGRDIGTVVLPDATIKIYLTASAEVRAKRRFDELQKKGDPSTYEEVLADVIRRDEQDTTRKVDPLRPAEDAQILDSSDMTQEQVVQDMLRRINLKLGKKPAPPEEKNGMYRFVRAVFGLLFKTVLPVTYHHIERAQMDAPYILLGNHSHMFDPMLIGYPVFRYNIRFMSKKELMNNAILRFLLEKIKIIPVDRHNMDMGAVRASLKTLKDGHVLGIFPEGTRHKEGVMQDMESGVSMIALRSGCRLLPAYISDKPALFKRVHVYFGDPISLKDIAAGGINKETCDQTMERIGKAYRELVEEHQKNLAGR
ncbi:MAG: (d)CMP kinase [Clostridia bacterium]|nr:(d)CMP kinase [Clostridia bacterium]